jgi:hypothetical protein
MMVLCTGIGDNGRMTDILLATLNARYSHASLGLRCLRANMGALHGRSAIKEFVIGQKTEEIAEAILAEDPNILGLGVYIWNCEESLKLVLMLKAVRPELIIVLGGPEVSYECAEQAICTAADYTITGWGDISFAQLCAQILAGQRPEATIIPGIQAKLPDLASPYGEYTDEDIRQRHLYVEASRGCPFKCEFCLSALDKTAWPFPLEAFLADLEMLWQKGARQFKFVDRTFNLKIETSLRIMDFFLDKIEKNPDDMPFAHFELIPDHLPEKLKEAIARFPAGTLQFEIGIQTFNVDVQARISRKQKNELARDNILWLGENSGAHLHVDLIAGLPGESIDSFAEGFDRLVALNPDEVQFGILKRLRGAPIARHSADFQLRFNPAPPYNILSTDRISFSEMQGLSRFSRYWDMLANSGRYAQTLPLILADSPFRNFHHLTDWLYAKTRQTHAIAHERMVHLVHDYLIEARRLAPAVASEALIKDYRGTGGRSRLRFEEEKAALPLPKPPKSKSHTPDRQARHLQA